MAQGSWGGSGDTRVFRVNIKFVHGGQQCQSGFHLRDVGINTLTPENVANGVADFATTQFTRLLNEADQLVGVDVVNLATGEGFSLSYTNTPGLQPGTIPPSFITIPISLKGSIRRRYGNGRMLWPVWTQSAIAGNALISAARVTLDDIIGHFVTAFMDTGVTATMRLVHLHPLLPAHGNRPVVPATWYDVTSVRASTVLSSLRRRKTGVGS